MTTVRARRVYEEPEASDGRRVLVDRLWPRGLSNAAAHIDEWLKAIAPSDELRRTWPSGSGMVRGAAGIPPGHKRRAPASWAGFLPPRRG